MKHYEVFDKIYEEDKLEDMGVSSLVLPSLNTNNNSWQKLRQKVQNNVKFELKIRK